MDLKATALLKIIYLEMFGHDMSWAAFHVLEVMSSQKYLQKRVGYLAAVQSFRPDTEVLMLATNLLKKDISSPLATTMSFPLVALPHIITSSLAISVTSDLLPRLSHSNPNIRKKTVATLYRLALVHPETLRSAWPKIKDILMDEEEGSSVTAAVVNVVCELGWRRPRDFLSLAPRLFDLLVEGGNNWMAIKIIKLFAILTPLEPRLIKKLLPPLTTLIRTTPAMSLLYECINGVIQGGVLDGTDGAREGEEIALLCVQKLRGMIVIEGDPNLKYVALLAFTRILPSHPHLVSTQQDVIMACIDDQDISIRMQALELGAGMVTSDTITIFVERLIQQLKSSPLSNGFADDQRHLATGVEPAADSDGEDPEESLRSPKESPEPMPELPIDYRIHVIRQIIYMCSRNTYANVLDFEWYIDILLQLVRLVPATSSQSEDLRTVNSGTEAEEDLSGLIGKEMRNVAVRVSSVRSEVVHASNSLLKTFRGQSSPGTTSNVGGGVVKYSAWIVGEYVENAMNLHETLDSLLIPRATSLQLDAISAYIQSVPKIFAAIASRGVNNWNAERRTSLSLLICRIVDFLEPLSMHPSLEVQERAVEFLELFRIASQAVTSSEQTDDEAPLLLTRAIPELFRGFELNPVAASAQRKVPLPDGLDLSSPINPRLQIILQSMDYQSDSTTFTSEFNSFYNERQAPKSVFGPAIDSIPSLEVTPSYQQSAPSSLHPEEVVRKRLERKERNKDDPFYIGDEMSSGRSTPFHDILRASNGEVVDVDSIPIMSLDLGDKSETRAQSGVDGKRRTRNRPKKFHVAKDETLDFDTGNQESSEDAKSGIARNHSMPPRDKPKKSLLEVDSRNLGSISLTDSDEKGVEGPSERIMEQETEMARALAEVERLRLEMQRASERIQASDGAPAEGTLVKKKKKKRKVVGPHPPEEDQLDQNIILEKAVEDGGATTVKKKKKKKKKAEVLDVDPATMANDQEETPYQ